MVKGAHARRYAQAVFEIALEKNELERWLADLTRMAAAVSDAAVKEALTHPKFSFEAKSQFISERLPEVQLLALNLLKLLITKGRLEIIGDIAAEYGRLLNSHHGIKQAEVTTAIPIEEAYQKVLAARLEAIVGSKVVVQSRVDPAVVGGFVARINGKLLDASTRHNLLALKRELTGAGG